jgi:hypothetical protein
VCDLSDYARAAACSMWGVLVVEFYLESWIMSRKKRVVLCMGESPNRVILGGE